MKVLIRELPEGHSERRFEEPASAFDLGDWLEPRGPVSLEADLEKRRDRIVVRGAAEVTAAFACGRCAEPLEERVEGEVLVVAELRGADSSGDEAALEAEGSILYHDGNELVLDECVREALILEVPAVPLCRPDCRGLCPSCGQNLNEKACTCAPRDADPRWGALGELRKKNT